MSSLLLKGDPSLNAMMTIFDRKGNRIFEKDHYGNKVFWKNMAAGMWWNGKYDPRFVKPEVKVPEGNYFFMLNLGNGKVIKGTVMVKYLK